MRSNVYDSLLKIGRDFQNSDQDVKVLKEAIQGFNQESLCLSIKNYSQFHGLSEHVHNNATESKDIFEIKGPLGPGVALSPKGKHIAYTAGTGVLVFVDLVAYLIIKLIEANGGPNISGDTQNRQSL